MTQSKGYVIINLTQSKPQEVIIKTTLITYQDYKHNTNIALKLCGFVYIMYYNIDTEITEEEVYNALTNILYFVEEYDINGDLTQELFLEEDFYELVHVVLQEEELDCYYNNVCIDCNTGLKGNTFIKKIVEV